MNKMKLLLPVNVVLFLSFLLQLITIIIIFFGIRTPSMQMVLEIHEYNGLLLVGLVILHLILNWNWVKANFFKKRVAPVSK